MGRGEGLGLGMRVEEGGRVEGWRELGEDE
jgi:hypothetical protein